MEKVDQNFHSSLLTKKGTFYNYLKNYAGNNEKEAEVIIGSRDMLSQNPDFFKYEKFDEDFAQKICLAGEKPKKTTMTNLKEFKENAAAHSRRQNQSMEKLSFLTPFQNNVHERFIRRKEIQEKIDVLKHREMNMNMNLEALVKTENFSKQLQINFNNNNNADKDEENANFDFNSNRLLIEKGGKNSCFTTANSTKSNAANVGKAEVSCDKSAKKSVKLDYLNTKNIPNNKDKSLNYLIFDRNKSSLSANVNSINSNGIFDYYYFAAAKEKSKKKENEDADNNNDFNAIDKDKLLKCVVDKLSESQKIKFYKKQKKEADIDLSEGKEIKIFSPVANKSKKKIKNSVKSNNKNEFEDEETVSPISRHNDSFYLNNIINNEKNKINNDNDNKNVSLKNKKKNKIEKNNSKVYLPNPFKSQKRNFDNKDLESEKERRHNMELSHNQNKPLLQEKKKNSNEKNNVNLNANNELKIKIEKNSDPYESYFKNTVRENNENNINTCKNNTSQLNNKYIKIENDCTNSNQISKIKINNNNNSKLRKMGELNSNNNNKNNNIFETKENINSFIEKEIAHERKKLNMSSNVFFANSDCNSHILGAMYQANKIKRNTNLTLEDTNKQQNNNSNNINNINNNLINEPIKQHHPQIEVRLISNKSRNSNNNVDTDSYKFSNHSSFDLENNIIEVKSKYGRENESNFNTVQEKNNHNYNNYNSKNYNKANFGLNNSNGNSSIYYNKSKKIDISEIKNAKINQTLNENVFKEVKKNIINLEYPKEEDSVNNLNNTNNKSSFKVSSETQTQKNFMGKKLNNRIRSVITPSALMIKNLNSSESDTFNFKNNNINNNNNNQSESNYYYEKNNNDEFHSKNNKEKLLITNYPKNTNIDLEPIKSNAENFSTKNSNIVIYTINTSNNNHNSNNNQIKTSIINEFNQNEKGESTCFNDTSNNLPSAQNTSNSKKLKSKSRVFTNRESPFKNQKIKQVLNAAEVKKRKNAAEDFQIETNMRVFTTKNAADIAKSEVVLEFQYPPGSSSSKSKRIGKENEASSFSFNFLKCNSNKDNLCNKKNDNSNNNNNNSNNLCNNNCSSSGSINNNNNYINNANGKAFNKKIINRSCTSLDKLNSESRAIIVNNNNSNFNADNSRISNISGGKSRNNSKNKGFSRSNSLNRNHYSPSGKKDWTFNLNAAVNSIKEAPQYFLNRNIMEEYEKIKSHTRKYSENQIIYSELKYKLDIMHENKSNFTNLLNEEFIKGNVAENNNYNNNNSVSKNNGFILPKI